MLAKLRWGCADHDDGSLIKVVLRSCQLFHLNANKESIVFPYLFVKGRCNHKPKHAKTETEPRAGASVNTSA